jgi:hypothetical protein
MKSSSIHLVHLSEDQILNVLSGDVSTGVAAHLANCSICSRRVAEFEAPIASFKAVTLAWSERRSATLPLEPVAQPPLAWYRRAVIAATATTALLVGISVPLLRNAARSAPPAASASESAATPPATEVATESAPVLSPATLHVITEPQATVTAVRTQNNPQDEQIARDNEMLQNIDQALDNSVESPADAYAPQPSSGPAQAHQRATTLQLN